MRDGLGRSINYMRLSVTDRCNLRCIYCVSKGDREFIPHENILSYEEMLRLTKVAADLGVEKVRLTGGEPLARRDFLAFLGMLKEEVPGLDVRVTTNATMLSGKVPALKHLGVSRVNISLDTLDAEKFKQITGRDFLFRVLESIDECLKYGLTVKLNVVGLKGINSDELPDFVNLALSKPLDLRIIEFMPIGCRSAWRPEKVWSADEILKDVAEITPIEAVTSSRTDGPARVFSLPEGVGRLGVISPVSNHFCDKCNRLRITSDGKLRTCLFSDTEHNLRSILRGSGDVDKELKECMLASLADKPLGRRLLEERKAVNVCDKPMTSIGG